MARSRTRATKSLTTLKLTSASSSAQPDLAHRGIDVGLADPAAAGQVAERLAQALAEGVEHGPGGTPSGGGPVGGDGGGGVRVVRGF